MSVHNGQVNQLIEFYGGAESLGVSRIWEKNSIRIVKDKEHINFNKECLKNKVIPKSIKVKLPDSLPANYVSCYKYKFSIIKNRIANCYRNINTLLRDNSNLMKTLKRKLPHHIINIIKNRTSKKVKFVKINTIKYHRKKLSNLLGVNFDENYRTNNCEANSATTCLSDNWIINLSTRIFNKHEISVLKLDPKFQIVPTSIRKEQIVANIEAKLEKIIDDKPKLSLIRLSLVNLLNNYKTIHPNLTKAQISAINKLKNYNDIIITNSDKGNKTVVMNRKDYLDKITEILSDKHFYEEIDHDDTKYVANNLIKLIKRLKEHEYITYYEYLKLYPDHFDMPRIYALIKVHKQNNPARLICPYSEHPLANFSKFISDIITPIIKTSIYSLKDSRQFVKEIQNLKLNQTDIMVSLDIVNLFTNIPINFTLNIIENKLNSNRKFKRECKMSIYEIINSIKFIMQHTSFSFNSKFYKQTAGAAMGCPLSPIVAESLVSYIFETTLEKFPYNIKYCRFYVDDSFIVINKNNLDQFLVNINTVARSTGNIVFTLEKELEGCISFLDVKLSKFNNKLITSVYRKPTHSNRYLDFFSHHCIHNKISVIRTLISRDITHNNNEQNKYNALNLTRNILMENHYPEKLINNVII